MLSFNSDTTFSEHVQMLLFKMLVILFFFFLKMRFESFKGHITENYSLWHGIEISFYLAWSVIDKKKHAAR